MDTNELFWDTGIDNSGLRANQQEAIQIFTTLANRVTAALDEITQKYGKVIAASKVKFDNPVDPSMISSIKTQIETLGKTIDMEITKLGNFTAKYDQSMTRISKSAAKLQVGNNSPLAPMVAGIQKDVAKSTEELSFLERRFKYAFGSALAYGSMRIFKGITSDIIDVKTQFEFLQTAINSFAGSAEKGAKIMHELTQFAVNSPLQVNDITEAAKQLMAFGIGADNVVGQIKMLSDVAAGAGKPIKEIAYIYGKSLTEGKVYTRTLMQFGNLGIPIYEALAKVMDTTPAKIKKMTQMGAVGFEDVKRAIESLTAAGGQYYGFSEKMMSTTAGLLSNVKDKWIIAMKDMGESSDGFINMSVQLVDSAIANWKALGDTILIAATAVGTYQVAKMVSSLGTNISSAAYNIAEANSLATLISAESAEGIAKQGLVVGSIEYQMAVKAEIALMMQKAEAAVVAAEAEVASATEAVVAQNTLVTSAKLRVSEANLVTAAEAKQVLTTGIATAATEAQVVGTDLLAAAQARLIVMFRTLTATMAANPYTAAAVAIATVVAVMWALHDSTTAAEKAQKKLKIALDEIQAQQDRLNKKFSDNLDIIKNPVYKNTPEQQKAFQILHDQFGSIIGDMKIKDLIEANSTVLQNKTAQAVSYTIGVRERENKLKKEGNELDAARAKLLRTDKTITVTTGGIEQEAVNPAYARAQKDFEDKRLLYKASLSEQKEFLKNYNASNAAANAPLPEADKNESFWTLQKKDAAQAIKDIDSYSKARLDAANKIKPLNVDSVVPKVDPADVKGYVENNAKLKEADAQLLVYQDAKNAKAATRAIDLRKREAAEAAKRLEAIRANNTELANLKSKAETDATQAAIDAMDAGYAKEKAQQENNFEKKMISLASEKAKMLKMEQENVRNIFLNMNPKGGKSPEVSSVGEGAGGTTAAYTSLLSQATAGGMTKTVELINTSLVTAKEALNTYNSEVDSAQKDNDAKLSVLLEKQLLEYGDYTAKKTEIERKYNDTLAALAIDREKASKKGDTSKVGQIDSATIQANVNKAKDLMSLSFDQLKSTPEYSMAFEDLNNVSTKTLEKLMGEMEKLKKTAAGTMGVTDFKEYSKKIQDITDKFIERNPFKVLKESAEELKSAQKDVENANLELLFAKSGLGKDSTGKVGNLSGVGQKLAVAAATDKLANAENNVTTAQNNGKKSLDKIVTSYGNLSKELSSVGSAIGGTAGEIVSAIGDIGSFVTSAITGWQTASVGASTAIQAVEKASVILAVISAVITVATKIASLFTDASKKRQEEAQKELDSIEAVKKAYLEAYATMTDKKFSNIFGDDVFGKATAQAGLMKKAADNYAASMKTMHDLGWSAQFLNMTNTADEAITNFDLLNAKAILANDKISASERSTLEAMVNSYESYVSYLDEIDSYLSGIFGSLGSNIMDSLVTDQDNMTQWADDVTGYISDSFTKMVKDIIYNMDFASTLAVEQQKIKDILANTTLDDKQKEAAMQAELIAFKAQLLATGTQAQTDWKTFSDAYTAAGMGTLGGTTTDNKNSLTSAIKGMDQPTADILTAQFSAVRIHTSNMDINLSKIGNNVSDLLLSLQGQAGILQIAFNDVAEIARNTRDLAGIKSILSDIKTYGVKVL